MDCGFTEKIREEISCMIKKFGYDDLRFSERMFTKAYEDIRKYFLKSKNSNWS